MLGDTSTLLTQARSSKDEKSRRTGTLKRANQISAIRARSVDAVVSVLGALVDVDATPELVLSEAMQAVATGLASMHGAYRVGGAVHHAGVDTGTFGNGATKELTPTAHYLHNAHMSWLADALKSRIAVLTC